MEFIFMCHAVAKHLDLTRKRPQQTKIQ